MINNVWIISYEDLTIRLLLAAVLGGLIGLEREWHNHPAGLRTHILVCLGSAAIMLLSIYGFAEFSTQYNVRLDPARLAAQVISGIGFLGAGAIMRTGLSVSGLTTAASIWVVAAIGLCAGAGFYYAAVLVTVLVLISLFVLHKMEKFMMRNRRRTQEIIVQVLDRPDVLGQITTEFGSLGIQIVNVKMRISEPEDEMHLAVKELRLQVKAVSNSKLLKAVDRISSMEDIVSLDSGTLPIAVKPVASR